MGNLGSIKEWKNNNGDYTHRLEYNLNENSIVFDLGGYEGWFSEQIVNKYDSRVYCFEPIEKFSKIIENKFKNNPKFKLYKIGVSNEIGYKKIYLNKDASSTVNKVGDSIIIKMTRLDKIMDDESIEFIDLIKLNIEGDEYDVLEYVINTGIQRKIENIQVQFHKLGDWKNRYEHISNKLKETHEITYRYPFVWENWKLK